MVRDKAKALERLQHVLDDIPRLKQVQWSDPAVTKWKLKARVAIEWAFGEASKEAAELANVDYSPGRVESSTWPYEKVMDKQSGHVRGLEEAQAVIESLLEQVEEYWPDDESTLAPIANTVGPSEAPAISRTVFIVHGHDPSAKEAMARFVEQIGLKPIILSEQPSQGLTIIEKFEANSNVSYTIVLLTGDDIGGNQGDNGKMRPRARQNVIFELGFFVGRLGRGRVCALTKGDPEIPSDYSGVVYIPMDEGDAWQGQLVKELKAAGFDIDANKLYV